MTDESFAQALDAFKAAKLNPTAESFDICAVYKTVKPILTGILPFLKLIPGIGQTISEAITLLMAALDKLCPASAAVSASPNVR